MALARSNELFESDPRLKADTRSGLNVKGEVVDVEEGDDGDW
jgi:hypothetical protein